MARIVQNKIVVKVKGWKKIDARNILESFLVMILGRMYWHPNQYGSFGIICRSDDGHSIRAKSEHCAATFDKLVDT